MENEGDWNELPVTVRIEEPTAEGVQISRTCLTAVNLSAITGFPTESIFLFDPEGNQLHFPGHGGRFLHLPNDCTEVVVRRGLMQDSSSVVEAPLLSVRNNASGGPPIPPPPLQMAPPRIPGVRAPSAYAAAMQSGVFGVNPVGGMARSGAGASGTSENTNTRRRSSVGGDTSFGYAVTFVPLVLDPKSMRIRPSGIEQVMKKIPEKEFNVKCLTKKISDEVGSPQVVCGKTGRKIPDDEVTRRANYWMGVRGGHTRVVYYLPEADCEYIMDVDRHRQEGMPCDGAGNAMGNEGLSALELMQRKQLHKQQDDALIELKKDLQCKICAEVVKKGEPTFCSGCKRFIGCKSCVATWKGSIDGGTCTTCRRSLRVWDPIPVSGLREALNAIAKIEDMYD